MARGLAVASTVLLVRLSRLVGGSGSDQLVRKVCLVLLRAGTGDLYKVYENSAKMIEEFLTCW